MGLFRKEKKEMEKVREETVMKLKDMSKEEQIKSIQDEIESELLKLPKRMQKRARKMADRAIKGQLLRPDEDIDNKKLIMEKK